MYAFNCFSRGLLIVLSAISGSVFSAPVDSSQKPPSLALNRPDMMAPRQVEHYDPIEIDASLSLSAIIAKTLEHYPDQSWLNALEQEAKALAERSQSWLAGAASADFAFQEATSGTLHYGDAAVQLPLWNFGQRDAEQTLALQADVSAKAQAEAVKLRIAGLVRAALWELALQSIRFEQSQNDRGIAQQLVTKVQKRVELGDLPRADLLLAESELLQQKSLLTQAEAEVMHARKRYISITQTTKVPADYQEALSALAAIEQNHPALVAINRQIARKQAEISALELTGSGQNTVSVGINTDRGSNDPRANNTESFNIGVSIPFGGRVHLAPQVAAAQVELTQLMAEREHLNRKLELMHHEAEHALEVNRAELEIANDLKRIAEEHLKMTQLSFSVGEINLMDLLKIQARTQQAVLSAKERAVMLQRDIALYNQAVGVLP